VGDGAVRQRNRMPYIIKKKSNIEMLNNFDKQLKLLDLINRHFKYSLIDVTDTAYMCKLWFESYGIEPTGQAIADMTRLVLMRERQYNENEDETIRR
jgi:hypothetical protein